MSNIIADKDEETALERLDLISELLSDVLDPSSRSKLRSQIAFNTGISERTIYRYEKAYKEDGIKADTKPRKDAPSHLLLLSKYLDLIALSAQLTKTAFAHS